MKEAFFVGDEACKERFMSKTQLHKDELVIELIW